MPTKYPDRLPGLAALDALIGAWALRVDIPDTPVGRAVFEWTLDGRCMLQRWIVPDPAVPDSLAIISYDQEADTYLQHYFDSRGVVRLYQMALRDRTWTLSRTEPDFSPLTFWQRFAGTISEDGDRIDARWERSDDGGKHWEIDFEMTYTRIR